jgi:hypothetical protein
MAYGHAERNLALIRQLEAETRQLLATVAQPDPDQSAFLPGRGQSPTETSSQSPCPRT